MGISRCNHAYDQLLYAQNNSLFCAGIIAEQAGETRTADRRGRLVITKTMAVFAAAIMGMIGMMPLNTFGANLSDEGQRGRREMAVRFGIDRKRNHKCICFIQLL